VASPEEVRITLSAPFAPFLSQLETLAIMPAEALAAGADMQQQPVGTGPFALAEWAPDTYLLLDAHEGYWGEGLPRLDALKFNIVPEAATRQVGLSGGTYQFLPVVDPAVAVTLTADPSVQVFQTLDLGYSLIGMNVSRPPFDDPRVREALNVALNRDEILQAAYFGLGEPGGPLSPALVDWAVPVTEFPCYAHDPEQARALLQEAGLSEPVAFTLNVLGSLQLVVDIAQVAQQQLNAAGFDVTLNVQEQGQFIQDWRNSNFDAFASLNGGFPDPDAYLYRTFLTGGSTNVFKYSDPALDELLERARTLSDPAERRAAYEEAQRMLACQGPIAHIAYGTLITAASPDLTGFQQIADRSLYYLREADLP
jgi:peptide/nickel transport system substrate-binding protein